MLRDQNNIEMNSFSPILQQRHFWKKASVVVYAMNYRGKWTGKILRTGRKWNEKENGWEKTVEEKIKGKREKSSVKATHKFSWKCQFGARIVLKYNKNWMFGFIGFYSFYINLDFIYNF